MMFKTNEIRCILQHGAAKSLQGKLQPLKHIIWAGGWKLGVRRPVPNALARWASSAQVTFELKQNFLSYKSEERAHCPKFAWLDMPPNIHSKIIFKSSKIKKKVGSMVVWISRGLLLCSASPAVHSFTRIRNTNGYQNLDSFVLWIMSVLCIYRETTIIYYAIVLVEVVPNSDVNTFNRVWMQCETDAGQSTGNGEKLSSSQSEPGQAIKSVVA